METIIIILIGCAVVSAFDAIGSILSRTLNFKYVWLTVGSLIIYGLVALYVLKYESTTIAVLSSFVVGAFDATIGFLISKKLKANIPEEDIANMDITPKLVLSIGVLAAVIGYITIVFFG